MNELTVKGLTKKIKNKPIIDKMDFTLQNGVCGLLGENGAGKTTLMRLFCGLLKESAGAILYNGENIKKLKGAYREKLGYLPQKFGYYPGFTAEEFLIYLAELKGLSGSMAKDRVPELLELVGLTENKRQKLCGFSGGMLQRVGIAQALLNDPSVLLLDEPTAGLDPMERIRFRNIIASLGKEKIVLISTHIVSDIEYIADEIMIMEHGKRIIQGAAAEIRMSARGQVWECESSENIAALESRFLLSSLKKQEKAVKLGLFRRCRRWKERFA